jgi:hypothetical protein
MIILIVIVQNSISKIDYLLLKEAVAGAAPAAA